MKLGKMTLACLALLANLVFPTIRANAASSIEFAQTYHAKRATSLRYPSENERFGFGVVTDINHFDVSSLHAGWYVNWGTSPSQAHTAGLDYVQIIRLCDAALRDCSSNGAISPSGDALTQLVLSHPGVLWLVGNEPDSIYQDNVLPETYATLYHTVYNQIKSADPSALVANGGVVEATPLRLQYLDRILNAYQARYGRKMPVDIWNTHLFILQEVRDSYGAEIPPGFSNIITGTLYAVDDHDNLNIFADQMHRFRQWLVDRGEGGKQLIVSEYGILFSNDCCGFDATRVKNFMLGSFNTFLNTSDPMLGDPNDGGRLVQRWAWYSLDDTSFESGDTQSALFDPTTHAMRQLGHNFASYTQPLLRPWVDVVAGPLDLQRSGEDFILSLDVSNVGNTASSAGTVVFRDAINGAEVVADYVPFNAVPVRYGGSQHVQLRLRHILPGLHTVTATVEGVADDAHTDNNQSVRVTATGGARILMPVVVQHP